MLKGVACLLINKKRMEMMKDRSRFAGRALIEASGGVNLSTVGGIARTGVDIISVGALTHSVVALDLGLDVDLS